MNEVLANELRARVENLRHTSTLPVVLRRLMEVAGDENSSVSDLKRVIEHDVSIAARTIAMANNVYYSFYRKVDSLDTAILLLGFDTVKGIALSIGVFNLVGPGMKDVWTHSCKTAMASRSLADEAGHGAIESAFLAGLLHDIGKVVLFHLFGDRYLEELARGSDELSRAEEKAFGAAHASVGAWFAQRNGFSERLSSAIELHHNPGLLRERYEKDPVSSRLPLVVFLADQCVRHGNKGLAYGNPGCMAEYEELLKDLSDRGQGMAEALPEVCRGISARESEIEDFFREHQGPDT